MKTVMTTAAVLVLIAGAAPADAGVTFGFNYNDAAGVGFNAAGQTGLDRRNAMELAASRFGTAFSSYNAHIILDVDGSATGGTLMGAGSAAGAFSQGFGGEAVVRNKILNGTDLNGSAADGSVVVNFSTVDWNLDLNGAFSGSQFDWYSTAYHEFAHALGFASSIQTDSNGLNANDGWGTTGANPGSWGMFDQFITDGAGNSVFSGADLNEGLYESLLIGGNSATGNGLFFNSADAAQLIGLYTPTSYEEGSSGSHIDDQNSAYAGMMMLAATGPGLSARTFGGLELSMFRDIGYTNVGQIVPAPSSLFMLAGLGAMATRRRR